MKQVNPTTQNESTDCMDGDLHILFKNTLAECTCNKKLRKISSNNCLFCRKGGSRSVGKNMGMHSVHYISPKFPCGFTKTCLGLSQFRMSHLPLKHEDEIINFSSFHTTAWSRLELAKQH